MICTIQCFNFVYQSVAVLVLEVILSHCCCSWNQCCKPHPTFTLNKLHILTVDCMLDAIKTESHHRSEWQLNCFFCCSVSHFLCFLYVWWFLYVSLRLKYIYHFHCVCLFNSCLVFFFSNMYFSFALQF